MAPSRVALAGDESAQIASKDQYKKKSNGHHQPKSPLELICIGPCLPGITQHPTFATHRQWMLEKMALAFRVFARKGYTGKCDQQDGSITVHRLCEICLRHVLTSYPLLFLDGMAGHISIRDPEFAHTFWTVSCWRLMRRSILYLSLTTTSRIR